ncbi:DUF2087 domain-containing protein [Virgibacillus salexigens]|uniref:DUF2087 domain-containing protein n=1 Tax=Virgibacillus kapii TaxID=1638645 RepID=A0ABQ2DL45_9BACI|nr:DUF2087 domain-containing protein [Virgibacillus kapii]GGJ61144.1 hypothetical protein GCM10007111_24130 [Virgibacillus kapii]
MDKRYVATMEEQEKVLRTFFKQGADGPIETFPSKEKRKLLILQHIITRFDQTKNYTEKEVNDVLKRIYRGFAIIRRYLIDYGFMKRNKDGSKYWVNV